MGGLSFSDRAARSMWRMVPKRAVSGAIGWGVSLGIPAPLRTLMLSRFARIYGIDVSEAEKPLGGIRRLRRVLHAQIAARRAPDRRRARARRFARRRHHRRVRAGDGGQIDSGEGERLRPRRRCSTTRRRRRGWRAAPTSSPTFRPRTTTACIRPSAGGSSAGGTSPGRCSRSAPRASGASPGLFVRNERFITLIEMDGGGLVAVVMVAAVGVGHVTVSYDPEVATHRPEFFRAALRHRQYDQPKPIRRGDELGIFHLGSTTIVVFEPRPGRARRAGGRRVREDGRRYRSGGVNDREPPRLKPGVEGPRRPFARVEGPHAWGREGGGDVTKVAPTARRRGGSVRRGRASAAVRSASAPGDFSTPVGAQADDDPAARHSRRRRQGAGAVTGRAGDRGDGRDPPSSNSRDQPSRPRPSLRGGCSGCRRDPAPSNAGRRDPGRDARPPPPPPVPGDDDPFAGGAPARSDIDAEAAALAAEAAAVRALDSGPLTPPPEVVVGAADAVAEMAPETPTPPPEVVAAPPTPHRSSRRRARRRPRSRRRERRAPRSSAPRRRRPQVAAVRRTPPPEITVTRTPPPEVVMRGESGARHHRDADAAARARRGDAHARPEVAAVRTPPPRRRLLEPDRRRRRRSRGRGRSGHAAAGTEAGARSRSRAPEPTAAGRPCLAMQRRRRRPRGPAGGGAVGCRGRGSGGGDRCDGEVDGDEHVEMMEGADEAVATTRARGPGPVAADADAQERGAAPDSGQPPADARARADRPGRRRRGRAIAGAAPILPEALAQRPRRPKRSKPWFEEVFDEDYLRTLPFMRAGPDAARGRVHLGCAAHRRRRRRSWTSRAATAGTPSSWCSAATT